MWLRCSGMKHDWTDGTKKRYPQSIVCNLYAIVLLFLPRSLKILFRNLYFMNLYTTSVLGTAPLKMGIPKNGHPCPKFSARTSAFWRVNVTKIGTGAAKFKRAETFSRGSLGTSSKRCRAQITKK